MASEVFWKMKNKAQKMESFGGVSQGAGSTGFYSDSQVQIKATGEWEEVFATNISHDRQDWCIWKGCTVSALRQVGKGKVSLLSGAHWCILPSCSFPTGQTPSSLFQPRESPSLQAWEDEGYESKAVLIRIYASALNTFSNFGSVTQT